MRRSCFLVLLLTHARFCGGTLEAQDGRVFFPEDETIAIWEMNELPSAGGAPLADGVIVPDLSGAGLHAVVEANTDTIAVKNGSPLFDDRAAAILNTAIGRQNGQPPPRVAVNEDGGVFEFTEIDDFSVEFLVFREQQVGSQAWGILLGTWHSRNLIDDSADELADGAWYGWGLIRRGTTGWLWGLSPVNPDGTLIRPGTNEVVSGNAWEIPPGTHYVVASVDRTKESVLRVYLDGVEVETLFLNPDWSFITPEGRDPARFLMLTGEDDASRNQYRPSPTGYHLDAVRVSAKALTLEEVEHNWELLQDGSAVPEDGAPREPHFVRADANADGNLDLSDGVSVLNFLFLGTAELPCQDAADADDTGVLELTDATAVFNFLFLAGPPPPLPHRTCGLDPTADPLGCTAFGPCP